MNKSWLVGKRLKRLEMILACLFLLALFVKATIQAPFMGDESQWIACSDVFEAYFQGDWKSPLFEDNYWNQVNPMGTRLIIGVGRYLGGFSQRDLNPAWNWLEDETSNVRNGAVPSQDLLNWSRLPMALMASLAGLALFWLVSSIAGRAAGYLSLVGFSLNPYFQLHLGRAMSEAPVLGFAMLAVCCFVQALRATEAGLSERKRGFIPGWGWWIACGSLCGLAGASKLNALALFPGIVLLVLFSPFWGSERKQGHWRNGQMLAVLTIFGFFGLAVFFLTSPYLMASPFIRLGVMFVARLNELSNQAVSYPLSVMGGWADRVVLMGKRIFEDYALINFTGAWLINLPLFLVGLWKNPGESMNKNNKSVMSGFAAIALALAIPALAMPMDWDRYYLFPVFFSQAMIAIGVVRLVGAGLSRISAPARLILRIPE